MTGVSVVVSTYNQPRALELVLWGYAAQTHRDFELVVADDGSRDDTRAVVDRLRRESGLRLVHVWHADRGFRKTEILNRAIVRRIRTGRETRARHGIAELDSGIAPPERRRPTAPAADVS